MPEQFDDIDQTGEERLWRWFSMSYASWLTLPRVLMHAMPDEWQQKMAALLEEYDATWKDQPYKSFVSLKQNGKFVKMPDWLDYRHPDQQEIASMRAESLRTSNIISRMGYEQFEDGNEHDGTR